MKLYHMIGLTTASLISLGTLAFMTNVKQVELNQDFKIESISGNSSELDGALLKGIIKTDQSNYSNVILGGDTFTITPTTYDFLYGIGEDKLANKELYRHAPWAKTFENDDYMITSQFDTSFPYSNNVATSHLAVKNKKTGQTLVDNIMLKEFSSQEGRSDEYITNYNGTYYYILTTYGRSTTGSRILVYTFNPDTLSTTFKFELPIEYTSTAETDGQMLYMTTYSNDSNNLQLLSLNLETEEMQTTNLETDIYVDHLVMENDKLFLISDSGIFIYNNSTESLETINPSFIDELSTMNYFWIEQSLAHENKVYILYTGYQENNSIQYLAVVDSNSSKIVFEGKIPVRKDQGLIESYTLIKK